MLSRTKVLTSLNGSLDSRTLFIAEAPGRMGADKFGIPLFGDQTGRNFESFILNAGISRNSIFVTNAVLCNPRKVNGNNDTPTKSEILNCSKYLEETLDIIKPKYVVPLGKVALTSLKMIHPLNIELRESVGQLFTWNGYQLYPLFHPGPRAFIWRSRSQQADDYRIIGRLIVETQYST
jgi:uracil-DNA glycosylase